MGKGKQHDPPREIGNRIGPEKKDTSKGEDIPDLQLFHLLKKAPNYWTETSLAYKGTALS